MVNRKPVKTLREFCLKALPPLITDHAQKMAHKVSALQWFAIFEGCDGIDREALLRQQVFALQQFIYEYVVWYDYEVVFQALLKGKQKC